MWLSHFSTYPAGRLSHSATKRHIDILCVLLHEIAVQHATGILAVQQQVSVQNLGLWNELSSTDRVFLLYAMRNFCLMYRETSTYPLGPEAWEWCR